MKTLLLRTSALALFALPALAQQAITTPIFTAVTSNQNFRDLAGIAASMGGTGYANATSHGGYMRTGVFYRSEALSVMSLSAVDRATLTAMHIGTDIDLRTPGEINGTPGILAPNAGPDQSIGAAYVNINIYGTPNQPSSAGIHSPAAAVAYLMTANQNFVLDARQRAAFHTVLITMADASGSVLYHCAGGKDRTGWTSMLLETIAGVPQATIVQDYLATNTYMAGTIAYTLNIIRTAAGDNAAAVAAPMLGVDIRYLQAGLDQVNQQYGSLDNYLRQGIGLTQADIYVLRAKMVYYPELPGQAGFTGNSANGAAFLNALQNSPLSGTYSATNYFLQSAVDAGTLGGVERQVGGQVHADAAAHLLRQPQTVVAALASETNGRDLAPGQSRVWLVGNGQMLWTTGHDGSAASSERSGGPVAGFTTRITPRASVYAAVGNTWSAVKSAGASADMQTVLVALGARYGLSDLDDGFFVTASANAGRIDYHSRRALGGGLGTALGKTGGWVYGGEATLGDVIRLAPVTLTPEIGLRVTRLSLSGFQEGGSELALGVVSQDKTVADVIGRLDISLDPQSWGGWTVTPALVLAVDGALDNPDVHSRASLYGIGVDQQAAYDGRYQIKTGLALTAGYGAWTVKAGIDGVFAANSNGIGARLAVGYRL